MTGLHTNKLLAKSRHMLLHIQRAELGPHGDIIKKKERQIVNCGQEIICSIRFIQSRKQNGWGYHCNILMGKSPPLRPKVLSSFIMHRDSMKSVYQVQSQGWMCSSRTI